MLLSGCNTPCSLANRIAAARPVNPSVSCPTPPTTSAVFGQITNLLPASIHLSNTPMPLPLANGALLRNVAFTEGSLRPNIAGTYRVGFSLAFGPNEFILNAEAPETVEATPEIEAARVLDAVYSLNAEVIAGVLLNGVPLSTSLAFASHVCCSSFTLQGSTMVALPAGTIVSVGVWVGCPYCSENHIVLMANSALSLERVGDLA